MKTIKFLFAVLFSIAVVACGGGGGSATPATYTISGTVTLTGAALPGVTVSLTGASTATTTTAADGSYSFTGLADGNYTVTSLLTGYAFNPAGTPVSVSGANVANTNFTAAVDATTYSISGTVTLTGAALPGVTINLAGASTATTTTAADGSYSFTGLANGNYTITPSLTGYVFSPVNTVVSVSNANVANTNFAAAAAATTYSISGTVSGAASNGVTITLGGDNNGSVMTGVGGTYTLSGLAFGNYTVTPSLSGSTFSPTTIAVKGWIPFEHQATGTGTLGGVTLTSVQWMTKDVFAFFQFNPTNPPDGVGKFRARRMEEIPVSQLALFANMWSTGGTVVLTYNSAMGADSMDIQLGTYPTITALASSASLTIMGAFIVNAPLLVNATGNDFVASGGGSPPSATYTISGTVTLTGVALPGVTINLGGASTATTTTAADGSYSFTGLANGNYTVTSSLTGYAFSPAGTPVSVSGANVPGTNFTAAAAATTYSISGTVSGDASSGVTIVLGGDNTGTVVTGAGGAWTISGLAFGNYTVTPFPSGYTFSPTTIAVNGQIPFEHTETGNGTLGGVTVTDVRWTGLDVRALFEIPNPPDGGGMLRARHSEEIPAPQIALFSNMWVTGGTVVVTFNSALGSDTIDIQLGTYPAITASSSGAFIVNAQLLAPATANNFSATAIP